MIREIVLDTETTGLDPCAGHRIVEIGAVELINHVPSGRHFHKYLNPERDVPHEAFAVHGLSRDFLRDKPCFAAVVDELEAFLLADRLIIHNAAFDLAFLNAELSAVGRLALGPERAVDTLALARQKHPTSPNSLDALCRRYGIDNTRRDRHGALLDAELLAEVYLELIGGRQASLTLAGADPGKARDLTIELGGGGPRKRPQPLPTRLTAEEARAHAALIDSLGETALWTGWLGRTVESEQDPSRSG